MIRPSQAPWFAGLTPSALGLIFALLSAMLFAVRPILVKLVYLEGVDSATLIFYRMFFSVPIYIALLCYFLRDKAVRKRLNAKLIMNASLAGMLGYFGASYLDLLGLQYVSAQLGRMILYSYPTFVVLLGGLFFATPITKKTIISLAITYLGIAIIFGHDLKQFGANVQKGGLLITVSAVMFAFYLLLSKSLLKEMGSRVFTCVALIAASFGIFAYYFVYYGMTQSLSSLSINHHATMLIITISILCTVIPTFCTAAAVIRIGADKTGIISMVGPAFTSVFAVWVLAESYTRYHFVGMILSIFGVALLSKKT